MKKTVFILLAAALSTPAFAQTAAVGFQFGASQPASDGVHFNFNDTVKELYFSTDLEFGTVLKLKGGQLDSDTAPDVEGASASGKIDYLDAIVEYRFDEVYGSSGLFAGPGYYRQRFGSYEESDLGVAFGANALFPVTRRFGLTAELAYHWVNFEKARSFVTATGGVRFGF